MRKINDVSCYQEVNAILRQYPFERMRIEKTIVAHTYMTEEILYDGRYAGTAIVGLLSHELESVSFFHKLAYDEIWHAYGGDSFMLYELDAKGGLFEYCLGHDVLAGQKPYHVVKKNVWQAAKLIPGGRYALYGCTMAPGFNVASFMPADQKQLIAEYPSYEELILTLTKKEI
ncbi:MAG: cupin domain-containing protein [Culicoidibacterales bacterium]